MNSFFLKAYLETVKESDLIPRSNDDLTVLLQNYLLEKAIYALKYELTNRPDKILIPLAIIRDILD
jgi:maltose alpha-D-glucosyltransferase/alpha-amylase